jgi:hypothetical protein
MLRRALLCVLGIAVVAGGLAWYFQSELIGVVAQRGLTNLGARDEAAGDLDRRREVVARMNRQLLMEPPADVHVPELFDVTTLLSPRVASGEISLPWAAYVFTPSPRDRVAERPTGEPRRSEDEIRASVQHYVEFYALQKRPDVPGIQVRDLFGTNDGDVVTLEEIEAAEQAGRDPDELIR